ncbi:hypothetical protein DKE41_008885 [Acinetobacter pittii]|nr:hypothetical protein DKE41_008885 [Acinetobacter pittii]
MLLKRLLKQQLFGIVQKELGDLEKIMIWLLACNKKKSPRYLMVDSSLKFGTFTLFQNNNNFT